MLIPQYLLIHKTIQNITKTMKRILTIALALLAGITSTPAQPQDNDTSSRAREEFQDKKFGIFLHWGLYSMLGRGEWVMNNDNINYQEYTHLADGFYPSRFDAEAWVKTVKAAGARYITITSRHHDGFSMFKTAQDSYNIVDGTPFRRDIMKELADACHKHGITLNIYYSHLDWHRPDYPLGRTGLKTGRPTDRQNYGSYLEFMKAQLTELLTQYGPVGAIWFDGWWDHDSDATPFDWQLKEQYDLIHRLQPNCLVANNHHQAPYEGEDIQVFEQDLPGENTAGFSANSTIGTLPLETCLTMNDTWGYDITDKKYKSAGHIITKLVQAAGKNANLLLNIGPRPDGAFPDEAVSRLDSIGSWLHANGATIYGTRGGVVPPHNWGVSTQRGKQLFLHILNLHDSGLFIPIAPDLVKKAEMYHGKTTVGITRMKGGVTLLLPETPKDIDTIVEITLK